MKIWYLILWIVLSLMACDRAQETKPLASVMQSTGASVDFKIPLVPGLDWEITQSWAEHCGYCEAEYPYNPNDPKDTTYCNSSHSTCPDCVYGWDFNLANNADKDKEVLASGNGTVKTVAKDSGWGNYVVIDHGGNVCSRYGHMVDNSVTVQEGQQACQGLVLGQIGMTGNAQSEHLHYQFETCDTRSPLAMGFTDGNDVPTCKKTYNGDSSDVYTNGTYTALLLTNVVRHSCDGSPPVGDAVLSEGMIQAACGSLQGCPLAPDCGRSASSHEFVDNDSLDARVKKAADYLYSECAVEGKADGALHPNDTINRAEALKIPLHLFGLVNDDCQYDNVPFTDVPANAWYYGVVACGISNGVIGTLRTRFKPGYRVNFAEAAKMAVEAGVRSGKIEYHVSTD